MKRRQLIAAGSVAALAACAPKPQGAAHSSQQRFQWKMVTSWPPNFPGLGTSVVRLA